MPWKDHAILALFISDTSEHGQDPRLLGKRCCLCGSDLGLLIDDVLALPLRLSICSSMVLVMACILSNLALMQDAGSCYRAVHRSLDCLRLLQCCRSLKSPSSPAAVTKSTAMPSYNSAPVLIHSTTGVTSLLLLCHCPCIVNSLFIGTSLLYVALLLH